MATGKSESSRRSPRLAKSEEVKLAAKNADGSLVVETTRTVDISKHGAALSSQYSFPLGAAIALRRSHGKPMRGRVVSCRPGADGRHALGIEFVEGEGDWELEFPKDWQDSYRPESAPAMAAAPTLQPGHDALEALVTKAEALRVQAESLLAEFQGQLQKQKSQHTADLAAQTEKLRGLRSVWEAEARTQIQNAQKSIQEQIEHSLSQFRQTGEGWQKKVDDLRSQIEAALHGSHEKLEQQRVAHEKQGAGLFEQHTATLEARRRELAELEERASQLAKQSAAQLEQIRQDARQAQETAVREIQAAGQAAVKDSQDRLPSLKEEFLRTLAPLITEQQTAASQAVAQALDALRSSGTDLENRYKRLLEESQRTALEQHQAAMQSRLEEFSKSGEAALAALGMRLEQARAATTEAAQSTESAAAKAREAMTAGLAQTAARLQEIAQQRLVDFKAAEAQLNKRLEESGEAQQLAALEGIRKIDQSALDLEALAAGLHQAALKDKQELESHFASLMSVYENRKAALDRLLATVESGRTSLRSELETLRVDVEEHRAGLRRFTAEQETILNAQIPELEKKLHEAVATMESALEKRATATLEAARGAFATRLEEASGAAQERFRAKLAEELATASRRIPELAAALDVRQQELGKALEQAAAGQLEKLREAGTEQDQQTARHREELAKSTATHQEAIQRSAATAQAAIEERNAAATASLNALLATLEQQRLSVTRLQADTEGQIQRWRRSTEEHFTGLSASLDEKRAKLQEFYTFTDQTRSSTIKNMAAVDRRLEDLRATAAASERQIRTVLEERAAEMTTRMEASLREAVTVAQRELAAESQAAEGVFQARIKACSEEGVPAFERQIERAGNNAALALDRTMQKERREHERKVQELDSQSEEHLREEHQKFRLQTADAAAAFQAQLNETAKALLEQVREARESLLREIPGRMAAAETEFRKNLEKIQAQHVALQSRRAEATPLEAAEKK